MFDRDFAERAVEILRREGIEAAMAATGRPKSTLWLWAGGKLPHERSAGVRIRTVYVFPEADGAALTGDEKRAYEAAKQEVAVLRAVLDALKAGDSLSTRQRLELAEEISEGSGLPLAAVREALGVSRQLAWYLRTRPAPDDPDADIRALVAECSEAVGRRGYRAVHAEMRRRGARCSEKRVRRVMAQDGLVPRRRRRRRYSSYQGEISAAPPNLCRREDGTHDFGAAGPWELLVTDLTEFRLPSGEKVYLSPVVDCWDGCCAAWSIGCRPDAELANSSLLKAVSCMPEGSSPVVHSDRGCHYRWTGWVGICEANGITRSMSRKGASPDNARAEGFFGTLKQEFFYSRDWEGVTAAEFAGELDDWLWWFNHGRIKESLGWLTYEEWRVAHGSSVPAIS